MKNIIVKIVTLIAVGVPEGLIIDYLKSENMTEIMWLSIFIAVLYIAVIWVIFSMKNTFISGRSYYDARIKNLEDSVKTHLITIQKAINGIIDSTNNISVEIVNKNLKDLNLKPPQMVVNVEVDERIGILSEQIMVNLQKLRNDFDKAVKS